MLSGKTFKIAVELLKLASTWKPISARSCPSKARTSSLFKPLSLFSVAISCSCYLTTVPTSSTKPGGGSVLRKVENVIELVFILGPLGDLDVTLSPPESIRTVTLLLTYSPGCVEVEFCELQV